MCLAYVHLDQELCRLAFSLNSEGQVSLDSLGWSGSPGLLHCPKGTPELLPSASTSTSAMSTEKIHPKPGHCSESSLPSSWIISWHIWTLRSPLPLPSACCPPILLQARASFVNGNQIMLFSCLKPWDQNEILTADLYPSLPPIFPLPLAHPTSSCFPNTSHWVLLSEHSPRSSFCLIFFPIAPYS